MEHSTDPGAGGRAVTRPLGTRSEAPPAGSDDDRGLPDRVERFVVLELVGEGGMGQVLAAYDPVLDRRVALKRLHAGRADATARARLRREARAMARLSHPRVVAVHDVIEAGQDVYVAMDYVEGQTLRSWAEAEPRTWAEVLRIAVAAGEGLAAAHEQGVVHRDFKPDNVLVDEHGQARVTDFGLAVTADDVQTAPEGPRPMETLATLTQTGARLGTPRYMAPEQLRGEPADERSDQFAFCVTLYELLYGHDPFDADEVDRARAVLDGTPRPPPRSHPAPEWLGRAVLRGLARAPDARWPSMAALLGELKRDRRRRRPLVSMVALASIGVGAWWWSASPDPCASAGDAITGDWNERRRTELRDAMHSSNTPGADEAWERVDAALDEWTTRWRRAQASACLAHLRGERSDAMFDKQVACLDELRWDLRAATRVLSEPDEIVVQRAARAASELPAPERCSRAEVLLARAIVPDDPAVARQLEPLRERFVDLRASASWAGRHAEAIERYDELLEALDGLPAPALRAEILYQRASSRSATDEVLRAKRELLTAYAAAERADADDLKARIAAELVELVPRRGLALEDVDAWAELAETIATRAEPEGRTHGQALSVRAKLHAHQGRYDDAVELARRARSIYAAAYGPEHARVAVAMTTEAGALAALGQPERALELYREAHAILTTALGEGHPEVAGSDLNLANLELELGELESARTRYERAITTWRATLGPRHTRVAAALYGLGTVHEDLHQLDEALRFYEDARAIWEARPELEPGNLAIVLDTIAMVHGRRGEPERAVALLERAAELEAEHRGRQHPAYAAALGSLARILLELDRLLEAEQAAREAISIVEASLGPQHPRLVGLLSTLADVERRHHRLDEAEALLRRALEIAGEQPAPEVHASLDELAREREVAPAD